MLACCYLLVAASSAEYFMKIDGYRKSGVMGNWKRVSPRLIRYLLSAIFRPSARLILLRWLFTADAFHMSSSAILMTWKPADITTIPKHGSFLKSANCGFSQSNWLFSCGLSLPSFHREWRSDANNPKASRKFRFFENYFHSPFPSSQLFIFVANRSTDRVLPCSQKPELANNSRRAGYGIFSGLAQKTENREPTGFWKQNYTRSKIQRGYRGRERVLLY